MSGTLVPKKLKKRSGIGNPRNGQTTSVDAPAPSRWDSSELLDVHVDQLPRPGPLVAADHPAGGPVHPVLVRRLSARILLTWVADSV